MIERTIAGDEVHRYRVDVAAGSLVHVQAEQLGVDLRIALDEDPGAKNRMGLEWIDTISGIGSAEQLWWLAGVDGRVEVVVARSREAPDGRYRLQPLKPRPPEPVDHDRVAGQRLMLDGKRLEASGDQAQALLRFQAALATWQRSGDSAHVAYSWWRIGALQLALGQLEPALGALGRARAGYQQLPSAGALTTLSILRGDTLRQLGRYAEAIIDYEQAREIAISRGDGGNAATAINNLGLIAERRGQLQRAEKRFDEARALYRQHGPEFEPTVLINLARVRMRLGALQSARKALDTARVLCVRFDQPRWRVDRELGWWFYLAGRPRAGIEPLLRALRQLGLELGPEMDGVPTTRNAAGVLDRLGTVLAAAGDALRARQVLDLALEFFSDNGYAADTAHTQANLCRLLSLDEPVAARRFCLAALSTLERLGELTAEAQVRFELAHLERREGDLHRALQHSRQAVGRLDAVRSRFRRRDLRASFTGDRKEFDDLHIAILMDLHTRDPAGNWGDRALQESERARGRILLEMLAEAEVDLRQDLPSDLRLRIAEIESRIEALQHSLREGLDSRSTDLESRPARESQLEQTMAAYHAVESEIRERSPAYAELNHPQPVELRKMLELLGPGTSLLSYWLGAEQSYVWMLDRERLTVQILPGQSEIERVAQRWYEQISRDIKVDFRLRQRRAAGILLAKQLLEPVLEQQVSPRLVIIADGPLQLLPFAALPDPRTGYDRPLLERHEVIRLPSLASLDSLRRRRTETDGRPSGLIAIVSDPVFSQEDPRLGLAVDSDRVALPRLVATADEARAILRRAGPYPSLHLEGFAARRQPVLEALADHEIVHFATHAILDPERPLLSRIVLSQFDAEGKSTPNDVRALDLYRLQSRAKIVVLSACKTVQELRGQGLVGLTRGFMYAGTPRLIAGQWQVDDRATADLMALFYRNLWERRMTPSRALRQAQISMHDSGHSPYRWAAFAFYGDWNWVPSSFERRPFAAR